MCPHLPHSQDGDTAFIRASSSGQLSVVEILLAYKADDINIRNKVCGVNGWVHEDSDFSVLKAA